MALTSATPVFTTLYFANAPMGSIMQSTIRVVSDVDLTGNDIYVDWYRWAKQVLAIPGPILTVPVYGYSAAWPGVPATVNFAQQITPNSFFYTEPSVTLTTVDAFTFDINVVWMVSSDFMSFMNNSARNNLARLLQDKQPGSQALINSGDSAFSYESKTIFRIWVTPDSGTTVFAIDAEFPNQKYSFYGESNIGTGTIPTPTIPFFEYRFKRAGQETECLSIYDAVRFEWRIQGNAMDAWGIGIARVDDITNDKSYINDLEYNFVNVDLAGNKTNNFLGIIDDGAFLNASATTFGAIGNQASILINPSYLAYGGSYRLVMIFFKGGIPQASFITDPISADCCPQPSFGSIVSTIVDYSTTSQIYTNACVQNVVPCERLRICVSMDKDSYYDTAFANGVPGTFDSNFISTRACVAAVPHIASGAPVCGAEITTITEPENYTVIDAANAHTQCLDFRVPESWAGTTQHLWFQWLFNPQVNGVYYRDEIWFPITISVRQFDSAPGGAGVMDSQVIHDGVQDPNVLCTDLLVLVDICAILNLPNPEDFSFIALLQEDVTNAETQEDDPYTNLNLPQLDVPEITMVDVDYTGGDACFKLDLTTLKEDTTYCVKAIAKRKEFDCDCIEVDLTAETILGTPAAGIRVKVDYTLVGILDPEVSFVVLRLASNPAGCGSAAGTILAMASGSVEMDYNLCLPVPCPYSIDVDLEVALNNGCNYRKVYTLTVDCPLTSKDSVNDPMLCVLDCLCIDLNTDMQWAGNQSIITYTWDLPNIIASSVASVKINYYEPSDPSGFNNGFEDEGGGVNSGSFAFVYISGTAQLPLTLTMDFEFEILLTNGCVYMEKVTHVMSTATAPAATPRFTEICSDSCVMTVETFIDSELTCIYSLRLQNVVPSVAVDSSQVTLNWESVFEDSCTGQVIKPLSNLYADELTYCMNFDGWVAGGGAYIDTVRVTVADKNVILGFVDVDMSATIWGGGTEAAFNTWITGTWLTAFEAALGVDTNASFGFVAANGVHYDLVATTDAYDVQLCWTARLNTGASPNYWCGPNSLDTVWGDYYPDGATSTPPTLTANNITSLIVYATEAAGVPCGTLHVASNAGDLTTPILDGFDGVNNFYIIVPTPFPPVTGITEGTFVPFTGMNVNSLEECVQGYVLGSLINDPLTNCTPQTYLWETDETGPWVIIGTSATVTINNTNAQNVRLTVTCGTCIAQTIIAIP